MRPSTPWSPPAGRGPRSVALLAFLLVLGAGAPVRADDAPPAGAPPIAPPAGGPPLGPPPAAPEPPGPRPAPAPRPAPPPTEDEVTLDNGSVFRGSIVEEDADKLVLQRTSEQGGVSTITFAKKRISTVRRAGSAQDGPTVVVVRDAWFLLRSGGDLVGTRRLVLRSVRAGGVPGFRLEETVVQLPQGRRIPLTRIERSEDTDARFLPRRLSYREALEPARGDQGTRYERSVTGGVKDGVWVFAWRQGETSGRGELSLPPETRGPLGLRELLLRDERVAGLRRVNVLDPARDGLTEADVGFAGLGGSGRPDEFHWVQGGVRRIARIAGTEILEETLEEGVTAVPTTEARARAVEADAQGDGSAREVTLAEQGLALTLPGADWSVTRPLASGLDAGWRVVARLVSPTLTADARVEWDPEGTPPGQTPEQAEAALLARLRAVCPDLAVVGRREPVPALPGAWRLTLLGTLRDTAIYTVALSVPRGGGRAVVLAACPESAWELGRPVLDRLLASVRGL